MEFDRNLMKLQGALVSFSNESSRDVKLKALASLFENAAEEQKAKMIFFLVLNTRLSITDVLKEDSNVGFLTSICPSLEVHFLVDAIINLKLAGFLSGIIANCPAVLSSELLDALVEQIKDSGNDLTGLNLVLDALFTKMLKIRTGQHRDCFIEKMASYYQNLFAILLKRLRGDHHVLDCLLKSLLFGVWHCKNNSGALPEDSVFQTDLCPTKEVLPPDEKKLAEEFKPEEFIKSHLTLFVDALQDVPPGQFENAYLLCQEVAGTVLEPGNLERLRLIGKKPVTVEDEIAQSNIEQIIEKVNAKKSRIEWFRALINREDVWSSDEAVACITSHLDLATKDLLKAILKTLQSELTKPAEENRRNLYFSSLKSLPIEDQIQHLDNYFNSGQTLDLESSSFDEEMTESFNKVSDLLDFKSELIVFCLQSPSKTIAKICRQALFDTGQLNIWMDHLTMIKSTCLSGNYDGLNLISHTVQHLSDLSDKERINFVKLITALVDRVLLDDGFVQDWVVDLILKDANCSNFNGVAFSLEIFRSCMKSKSFRCNEAVMLAFLAGVLSHASWDWSSFTIDRANAREIIISLIHNLMKNLTPEYRESVWLRSRISESSDVSRTYFCDLWSLPIRSSELDILLLTLLHTRDKSQIANALSDRFRMKKLVEMRTYFVAALIKILPIMISKEWMLMFSQLKVVFTAWSKQQEVTVDVDVGLEVFRLFAVALYCLSRVVNATEDAQPCFAFCIRNFGRVVQQNSLKQPTSETLVELMKGLLFVLNGISNPSFRKSVAMILSPVVLDIGKLAEKQATVDPEMTELQNWFKKDFI